MGTRWAPPDRRRCGPFLNTHFPIAWKLRSMASRSRPGTLNGVVHLSGPHSLRGDGAALALAEPQREAVDILAEVVEVVRRIEPAFNTYWSV
jgi:hypothetical protein